MSSFKTTTSFVLAAGLACAAGKALAVDGVVEINQARALKGGVTPGDAPGLPVTISVAGSYRLTSNLTLPDANTDGIDILADNVTIDLNGFAILGPVTCTGGPPVTACSPTGGSGVGISGFSNAAITVKNGTIQGAGLYGVLIGKAARVSGVTARQAGNSGVAVAGGAVTGCVLEESRYNGVFVESNAGVVSDNVVRGNGSAGVFAQAPSSITGNTVEKNGSWGIIAEQGGTVVGNTVTSNTGVGIACTFTFTQLGGYAQNVLTANNGGGIQVTGCTQLGTGTNLCNGAACP